MKNQENIYSMNDMMTVELTPDGVAILSTHMAENRCAARLSSNGHRYRFQMWEFASIFGSHMYNGGPNMIVDNCFEFIRMI